MDTFMGMFSGQEINFQNDNVISNKLVKSAGDVKNFFCLVVKQRLYRQRCLKNPLSVNELKNVFTVSKTLKNT